MAGLAAALFLARRGHQVDILERDEAEAPADSEAAFADWKRRGVPQARHPHAYLGLSSKILDEEAPELLAELQDGAYRSTRWSDASTDYAYSVGVRRLVYEARFRRAVQAEPGVTFERGARVTGLVARDFAGLKRVVGVLIEGAGERAADLVVDASGRWTEAGGWLAQIGARPWREELQETPIFYLTQWYRLKDGALAPGGEYPLAVVLPYIMALAFRADHGVLTVVLAGSMADPLRRRLRDPEVFARFLGAVPLLAPILDATERIGAPLPLAGINNCHRRLVDEAGPCVLGFMLLGDAADHTNPTNGRGVSLGFAHAQRLAQTAEQAVEAPEAHAVAFDRWATENIAPWFRANVAFDASRMAALEASLTGKPPEPPPPAGRFRLAAMTLAEQDPEVARAVGRERHLLAPPGSVEANPAVAAKVRAFMEETKGAPSAFFTGPSRREFETLVG
jgi:2-polyprenyl-6-methoxyphenol hydroxylase-like FAD-dependent oxidoreductase